jgi:hypothetical protein
LEVVSSGEEIMAESCEQGKEPSISIKGKEFLDHPNK